MTIKGTVIGIGGGVDVNGKSYVEFVIDDADHGGATTYRATNGGTVEIQAFAGEVLPRDLED